MKTKFYWVALLASAAMIAQVNAGGHYRGGGGGFVPQAGPARAAAPSFNSAASRSFGGGRMIYSGQRFSPATLSSPSSPASRQYYINTNSGMRQFARGNINRADSHAGFSNGGNRAITNVQRQGNGPGQSRSANNLPSNWRNHVVSRHDANWHGDWDRRHAHFHNGRFFVFIGGFWCGLDDGFFPWDYFPYYANDYYPYDYYTDVDPYDYNAPIYNIATTDSATVQAVQTQLARLGYYGGSIDGVFGLSTRDAVARYQIANQLNVTGSLSPDTLRSLGLTQAIPS